MEHSGRTDLPLLGLAIAFLIEPGSRRPGNTIGLLQVLTVSPEQTGVARGSDALRAKLRICDVR